MGPALLEAGVPPHTSLVDARAVFVCALAIALAVLAALSAQVLLLLIALVTNVAFYGRISFEAAEPTTAHWGIFTIIVPVVGGLIVGFMARYGSKAIRGHGIPEAMEQVLLNKSRIPARMTFLKPLSSAVAIGSGGPFGAEGPIIATGGALGSLIGQVLRTTAAERKTLLAAGAAAGMAAVFGSPVSAVLLAVELLLFEYKPRSIIPVALASATAAGVRIIFHGADPVFPMPNLIQPAGGALAFYILLGAVIGVASVLVTRIVYGVEDLFEKLPIHWMWWPALGAVVVGVVGYFYPLTMGVGYENITHIISGRMAISAVAILCLMKFISWTVALGSGTSGGTLAPLFTIGGGLGAVLGAGAARLAPAAHIDIRIAALVGMAAIFAGASRALLASAVFAFETTLQPLGLLPLLGGCSASFLVSCLLMRNSIMTEKIARRGVRVPAEYAADFLDQILVHDAASRDPVILRGSQTIAQVRTWIESGERGTSHQGFPIVADNGTLIGVLTRRDLLDPRRDASTMLHQLLRLPVKFTYQDCTLREAADHMVNHDIGRLPVVSRDDPRQILGMLTRSDLLRAHRARLREVQHAERIIDWKLPALRAG